jgi:ActR/RegA family two-component response regulator
MCRIAVIEDETFFASAFPRILQAEAERWNIPVRIEVFAALSDARSQAHRHDLLLLDLALTDAAPAETIAAISELSQDTTVVVATGLDDFGSKRRECILRGAEDFLDKRLMLTDPNQVFSRIVNALLRKERGEKACVAA